jgi:hypothetical protein
MFWCRVDAAQRAREVRRHADDRRALANHRWPRAVAHPLHRARTRAQSLAEEAEVYADEAGAWNALRGRFTMHRINHQEAYSLGNGIHSNNAESFSAACAARRLATIISPGRI